MGGTPKSSILVGFSIMLYYIIYYIYSIYGGFHKWGVSQNGWFIRENPSKVDDLGVPLFQETSIHIYIHIYT